ncbi:NAD(P)-dependent dehydrogenase (short-subunit alcohol dehydrogenase family) [Fontibacillus phaseoli]|uniref:NAD(P)-dependent dehydrogenase (Short-subunit alcohol dehydrogenase family) n=1 Tax=Fontibacillus phaseoli TaxID=1416533 RepID=A0A369BQG1_9BACL|nr:SDR family oxidoreductase [Fontibacillus phaseoli]RCX23275.1 NAD(P)-dependent dehydrogenase (short-subunit alcohol dehydrogenase family) [Fontibacillus phaseoli]
MDLGLQHKKAVVTGGSKGIGLATALTLASEGVQVAIVARDEENLKQAAKRIQEKTGAAPIWISADVSVREEAERAVWLAAERLGGLDILINNAGTSAAHPFPEVEPDIWTADLDLKLFGAVHFSRAALPYLREAEGGGAIVNVTAIGGKTPGASTLPTSVSRAAGLALTKAMSKDLAGDGIRVNAVCIGLIHSDQIERKWKSAAPDLTWEEFARDPGHGIPLGRIGEAQEAANAIVFLVSEAASYITGTSLNIDGGKSAVL